MVSPMRVYRDDQKFLTFRINALLWTIVAVFVFLAGSFWFVQGVQAEKYRGLSEANALREIVTPAKRGLILDRTGQKIIADNQAAYSLTLDRVVLRPFVIADDLSMPQVAMIQTPAVTFPELNVEPVQRRNYPYGPFAAHVLGFIGETSEKDLGTRKDLKQGDLIGKRGVELMYDQYLRGKDGAQYWEYDSHGRRLAEYRPARKNPQAGDNLYLTIDFDLQRRAEQYFAENELVGSAVALYPRNGEILAMVSSPTFNPNVYSKRFTPDVWKTIVSNPFKIELNRAIQGLYSPGSIFKTVMAAAGLAAAAASSSGGASAAGRRTATARCASSAP